MVLTPMPRVDQRTQGWRLAADSKEWPMTWSDDTRRALIWAGTASR